MSTRDSKNKAEIADSNVPSNDDHSMDDNSSKGEDKPKEIGGRGGLDPTRYGDWEKAGRCIDF